MEQRIFSELVGDRFEQVESYHVVESDSSPIVIHGSDSESDDNVRPKRSKIEQRLTATFPDGFPGPSSSANGEDQAVPMGDTRQPKPKRPHTAQPSTSVDEITLFVDDDEDEYFKPHHSRDKDVDKGKGKMGSHKSKHKGLKHSRRSSSHEDRTCAPRRSKSRHQKGESRSRDSSVDEVDKYGKNCKRKCSSRSSNREEVEMFDGRLDKRQKRKHDSGGGEGVKESTEERRRSFRDSDVEGEKCEKNCKRKQRSGESTRDKEDRCVKRRKGESSFAQSAESDQMKRKTSSWDSEDRHGKKHGKSENPMLAVHALLQPLWLSLLFTVDGYRKRHRKHHKRRSRSSSGSEDCSRRKSRKHSHHITCSSTHGTDVAESSSMDERCEAEETSTNDIVKEQLIQEVKAIDDEIRASKREILKSVLKKERIKLLHRHMQAGSSSGGVGVASTSKDTEQQVLQDELAQLNEKIVSEKRRLLKVVKHMEEEKGELD